MNTQYSIVNTGSRVGCLLWYPISPLQTGPVDRDDTREVKRGYSGAPPRHAHTRGTARPNPLSAPDTHQSALHNAQGGGG